MNFDKSFIVKLIYDYLKKGLSNLYLARLKKFDYLF